MKIKYLRRFIQFFILFSIIYIAISSNNPFKWTPSRISLGMLPPPNLFPISGNTWSLSIKNFNLLHPVAFIDAVVSMKLITITMIIAVSIPFLITLLFGRVYCSFICPMGLLFELNQNVHNFIKKHKFNFKLKHFDYRKIIVIFSLFIGFIFSFPLISAFDPSNILGKEIINLSLHQKVTNFGLIFIIILFCIDIFTYRRFFCTSICPTGYLLGLIGSKRMLRININQEKCTLCGKCDQICYYNLKPMNIALEREFDWHKCDNCGLCKDVCIYNAIDYKFSLKFKGVK